MIIFLKEAGKKRGANTMASQKIEVDNGSSRQEDMEETTNKVGISQKTFTSLIIVGIVFRPRIKVLAR